ncbi:MAG: Ryanodine receptor Ryr [Bacteroidales bacterium]|nr:Ryanodine receptor Ryr [Bacteroidales bacterium]
MYISETDTNNTNEYVPKPLDCSEIELPRSLKQLTEEIAENVHEVWAQGRIDEGWKYGPERNDDKKEHPCLVPYNKLPETEKEYDRNTAIGTLKLIMKLGYKITKKK